MATYKIVFADNSGSRAVDAIADACNGTWRDAVSRYDGTNDLAFVEIEDSEAEHLESILDEDDNVLSYAAV